MSLCCRETNLRYLALESMCLLATSEFSHQAVKKHQETVITALKVRRCFTVDIQGTSGIQLFRHRYATMYTTTAISYVCVYILILQVVNIYRFLLRLMHTYELWIGRILSKVVIISVSIGSKIVINVHFVHWMIYEKKFR